jgi:hypothetical protein
MDAFVFRTTGYLGARVGAGGGGAGIDARGGATGAAEGLGTLLGVLTVPPFRQSAHRCRTSHL